MRRSMVLLSTIVVVLAFADAEAVVIKTSPEESVWIADGTTEYRMFIYVDNTEVDVGDPATDLVEWKLDDPFGFEYVGVDLPTPNHDFFAGFDTASILQGVAQQSGRWAEVIGIGPIQKTGYVAVYRFRVPADMQPGDHYYMDLIPNTATYDIDISKQLPLTRVWGEFGVRPFCEFAPDGDMNDDSVADGADIIAFVQALSASPTAEVICHGDFNDDGHLDAEDVPGFVAALLMGA